MYSVTYVSIVGGVVPNIHIRQKDHLDNYSHVLDDNESCEFLICWMLSRGVLCNPPTFSTE